MNEIHLLDDCYDGLKSSFEELSSATESQKLEKYCAFGSTLLNLRTQLNHLENKSIGKLFSLCHSAELDLSSGFESGSSELNTSPSSEIRERNSEWPQALPSPDLHRELEQLSSSSPHGSIPAPPARSAIDTVLDTLDWSNVELNGQVLDDVHSLFGLREPDFYSEDELPIMEMCETDFLPVLGYVPTITFTVSLDQFPEQSLFAPEVVFRGYMIFLVSPLEFYVLKEEDHIVRFYLECLLVELEPFLCQFLMAPPPLGSDYEDNRPCLALVGDKLHRAVIRFSGIEDVQVYLLDYGICHFVTTDCLFEIPEGIVKYAYPLAHYCTLEDADSRLLDTFAWKAFLDRFADNFHIAFRGLGAIRRTHGHLVELIDDVNACTI